MGRKAKFSKEVKLKAVKEYLAGSMSSHMISDEIGCHHTMILSWVKAYEQMGESVFDAKPRNKSYSKKFKMTVINEYLKGEESIEGISKKYGIYSSTSLRNWLISYNSHKEIKDYDPKGDIYMTKSRKTTYEERIEVVKYCIENKYSYKLTAAHFNLPYSQVYQWVQKYIEKGQEGLLDGRGRTKHESELSETDKLKRDNEILQARIQRLEMENEVLKKLKEIERGLTSAGAGKKRST
jgi:transposase-like protein